MMDKNKLTRHEWKICEAVHLGLRCYYECKVRHDLTDDDILKAKEILKKLPFGWHMQIPSWTECKS